MLLRVKLCLRGLSTQLFREHLVRFCIMLAILQPLFSKAQSKRGPTFLSNHAFWSKATGLCIDFTFLGSRTSWPLGRRGMHVEPCRGKTCLWFDLSTAYGMPLRRVCPNTALKRSSLVFFVRLWHIQTYILYVVFHESFDNFYNLSKNYMRVSIVNTRRLHLPMCYFRATLA